MNLMAFLHQEISHLQENVFLIFCHYFHVWQDKKADTPTDLIWSVDLFLPGFRLSGPRMIFEPYGAHTAFG